MNELIDKNELLEKIEELEAQNNCGTSDFIEAKEIAFNQVKQALDSIEVKEVKEVEEHSASDRGMVEEIIINLKRVEQDYYIDLTKEMEWLRNIIK